MSEGGAELDYIQPLIERGELLEGLKEILYQQLKGKRKDLVQAFLNKGIADLTRGYCWETPNEYIVWARFVGIIVLLGQSVG